VGLQSFKTLCSGIRAGRPIGSSAVCESGACVGHRVIMDVVYNHFGPGDLDLSCFDG
jgi:hypothetical protein